MSIAAVDQIFKNCVANVHRPRRQSLLLGARTRTWQRYPSAEESVVSPPRLVRASIAPQHATMNELRAPRGVGKKEDQHRVSIVLDSESSTSTSRTKSGHGRQNRSAPSCSCMRRLVPPPPLPARQPKAFASLPRSLRSLRCYCYHRTAQNPQPAGRTSQRQLAEEALAETM